MWKRGGKKRSRMLDDDVVSLGFAPRFKEGLRLGGCLPIHHTSCGPGFDTLRCLPSPPLRLRGSCHACVLAALLPVFSPSLSKDGPLGSLWARSGAPLFFPPRPDATLRS